MRKKKITKVKSVDWKRSVVCVLNILCFELEIREKHQRHLILNLMGQDLIPICKSLQFFRINLAHVLVLAIFTWNSNPIHKNVIIKLHQQRNIFKIINAFKQFDEKIVSLPLTINLHNTLSRAIKFLSLTTPFVSSQIGISPNRINVPSTDLTRPLVLFQDMTESLQPGFSSSTVLSSRTLFFLILISHQILRDTPELNSKKFNSTNF